MEKNDILISHGLGLHAIVGPITPAGLERRTGQIEHSLSSSSEKNPELIDKFMSVTYLEFFSASDLTNRNKIDLTKATRRSVSMERASCEIVRLPEELLATVISLTSPPDAWRAAAVSRAFRAAANSDAVWSCFLPRDLPRFAEGELTHAMAMPPPTKKEMFLRLSRTPALLPCRLVVRTDSKKTTTKGCFFFSLLDQNRSRIGFLTYTIP
jgi:hypothetical protein